MEKSSPERQFKGIRIRKWGRWVSEIRMPKSREKRDAALYCLKGPAAKFNFPDSVPAIPSASSLSRQQIQVAAAKYALDEIPSTSFSLQDMKNNNNKSKEKDKPISLPRPSSISEMELSCDSPRIWESQDLGLLESPFYSNGGLNLEKIQSIDEVWALEFIPIWQEEQQQQEYLFFDTTDLWNF